MQLNRWIWIILLMLLVGVNEGGAFQGKDLSLDQGALFQMLDKNKDGKLSPEEFQVIWKDKTSAQEAFKTLDINGDGSLSQDEFGKPGLILFKF